jgi:phosphatidylglycerol:prolipoprotein diacylglycerol transferase
VAPACITVAHAFGRLGCLMAGCCYGRVTESEFFGIFMKGANRLPTQLYESIFLFILFAVISVFYFKKFNFTHVIYLVAYGIWRFIIEFFRADHRGGAGAISPSQWHSMIFILVAVAIVVYFRIRKYPTFVTYDLHESTNKKRIVEKKDKQVQIEETVEDQNKNEE